jgi:DNA-binding PadR family transcriptional regulator
VKIPELSHLQFVVLGSLLGSERTGREVREELRRYRVRQSGPAFYQMMARLESTGLVKGWYTQEVIEGQIIKERHYRLTAEGARAWRACRSFYKEAIEAAEGGEDLAHA